MDQLKLSNDDIFPISMAGEDSGILWITVESDSMRTVFEAFHNPENTKLIAVRRDEIYTGFTELIFLKLDEGNMFSLALRKPQQ